MSSPTAVSWKRPLAALCVSQFLAMLAMSQFLPFLTLYVQQLGTPDAADAARWSGILLGVGFLAAGMMAPLWGVLADRWGKKQMVLRAMSGSGIAVGLMAWGRGAWDLFALRVMQGTLGGFVSANTALVAAIAPASRVGTAVGAMRSSFMAGLIAGPLAGGLMLEAFGFRTMILSSAAYMAAGVAMIAWLVPAPKPAPVARPVRVRENFRLVGGSPVLRSASAIQFLVQAAFVSMHPVMVFFVESLTPGVGRTAGLTGAVFGVTAATTLLGAAFWGRRADKVGAPAVLVLSLGACALLSVPQAMVTDIKVFLALRAALGFFVGGIQPSLHGLIILSSPQDRRAGVLGVTFAGALFGNALGPVLGGFLAAHLGVRSAFLLVTGLLTAAWLVARKAFAPVEGAPAMTYDRPQ